MDVQGIKLMRIRPVKDAERKTVEEDKRMYIQISQDVFTDGWYDILSCGVAKSDHIKPRLSISAISYIDMASPDGAGCKLSEWMINENSRNDRWNLCTGSFRKTGEGTWQFSVPDSMPGEKLSYGAIDYFDSILPYLKVLIVQTKKWYRTTADVAAMTMRDIGKDYATMMNGNGEHYPCTYISVANKGIDTGVLNYSGNYAIGVIIKNFVIDFTTAVLLLSSGPDTRRRFQAKVKQDWAESYNDDIWTLHNRFRLKQIENAAGYKFGA